MNPLEIIDKILKGEKNEFRHLTKLCNQSLYRVAIVFLKNASDAEDVLQTTYLKAFVHLHTYRKESTFHTWITRILINECKMMLRSKKPVLSMEHPDHYRDVMKKPILTENVMDTIYNKELNHLLEQTVQALPEKYRLVYVLREMNEISTAETAAALGLTSDTVKVRLHRAKSILRDAILQQVPAHELFPFGNQHCQSLTDRVMVAIESLPIAQWS